MGQETYCRAHGLWRNTFRRWLKMFEEEAGQTLEKVEKRRKTGARTLSAGKRSKAVQAFWAMHVEAWQWSGLSASAYAKVHHLTRQTLIKWRDRLEAEPGGVDWRELVHPSARPRTNSGRISTGAKGSAKRSEPENGLTDAETIAAAAHERPRRRRFSIEEKLVIVRETERPDMTVSQVAREHQIVPSMIFRWRAELGFGKNNPAQLAAVRVADKEVGRKRNTASEAVVLHDFLPVPDGLVAVDLPDGRRVFAPADSDPEAVRRHVAEREAQP